MCLILVAYKVSAQFPLVIAANRDEFYARPTQAAQFWNDHPQVLAGKDLQEGGTWLGVTTAGRFAAVTNYRDGRASLPNGKPYEKSRGALTKNFLVANETAEMYITNLQNEADLYNGFNLLIGDGEHLYYCCNRDESGAHKFSWQMLSAGIYGLSNHVLNTDWPKVLKGKQHLAAIIDTSNHTQLQNLLLDHSHPPDDQLPNTFISRDLEKILSPIFIRGDNYGTRACTSVIYHNTGKLSFSEQTIVEGRPSGEPRNFEISA